MEVRSSRIHALSLYLTYLVRPGEELAASGFVAIVFYLFVDINLGIYRIFKRKRGLYYWCMLLGTWGCAIDNIAVVVKFFVHNPEPLWPLYTLFILLGWSIYATAQLLVLYSRLHLVNQNRKLQRWVLIMIIAVASLMIIPTWPLAWQAYNPYNPQLSARFSFGEAIIDRVTQLGFTMAESILSGIYIWSLTKLLNLKSSVRYRRVMTDLVYVNVIAVCLDVLTVILVYLNQTGISHPIQTFSYILKMKLEFMVLNQLMAVTARGIQREAFPARRYHHRPALGGMAWSGMSSKSPRWGLDPLSEPANVSLGEVQIPSPALSKAQGTSNDSILPFTRDRVDGDRWTKHGDGGRIAERDEDEEVEVHRWDERRRTLTMDGPWFKTECHA